MAILIVDNLTASPNPASLPKRVEVRQTLRSTLASEAVDVVYSLDPAHDVWFQDLGDPPSKQVARQETVGSTPQVCVDRLNLVRGPGTGPLLTVEISQTIQDSQGDVVPDLVVLQLGP